MNFLGQIYQKGIPDVFPPNLEKANELIQKSRIQKAKCDQKWTKPHQGNTSHFAVFPDPNFQWINPGENSNRL